ncbi:mediator of RNA polymerase II transcription subunit 30-like isoform X2 [Polistes fuscatus]|uniref:mediator of RNA polymerase II transcription subunit 30-like isoform X2 n=1 Tax=Polistes fuscatus TaxID=30207 RepID=UPI001CA88104|nr:mediator of RNA polymerase II transcription subunit 30-like isoform X2 [Polistes fuscatus]
MAGQQHPFPSGFPNVQQSAMRTQFGGGQMVSGLMGPQQGGIVSPQQFGVGVGVGVGVGGVGSNAMGMPNAQQVLAQQQQQQQSVTMQQQMQQIQQQQLQLQQQQQAVLVQQTTQTNNQATTPQTPVAPTQPPPQQQQNKDFNTASLCRFGQETVQDIVSRTLDVFQTLKVLQPPNGTPQGASVANDKKTKVQEQLRMLKLLFKRLRLIYEKCNENCQLQGMEYTHIESLIPLKEEWDMKSEEKKTSEAYRLAYEESKEITEMNHRFNNSTIQQ